MTRLSKKELERRFAEHFFQIQGRDLASVNLRNSERPDFLFDGESGTTGLEVVELFRIDEERIPLRAREGGWESVAAGCERRWLKVGMPHVEVWLGFYGGHHIPKSRVRAIVDRVVRFVATALPESGEYISFDRLSLPPASLPEELSRVTISRVVNYERTYWHPAGPGVWVPKLESETVQAAIGSKSQRLPVYRTSASEVWLLLVLHGWRGSSMMDVPTETLECAYIFGFERVYLLDTLRERAYELLSSARRAGR